MVSSGVGPTINYLTSPSFKLSSVERMTNYSEYNFFAENHVAKPRPSVAKTVWNVFCLLINRVDLLNNVNDFKSVLANLI